MSTRMSTQTSTRVHTRMHTRMNTRKPLRVRMAHRATMMALAAVTAACAQKDLLQSPAVSPRHVTLQLTTSPAAQQAGPAFVFVAAAYETSDGYETLAYKFAPLVQGSQQFELPVDLGPCIAYSRTQGRENCPLYVAAALVPDTMAIRDSTRSLIGESYDSAVPVGPFEVTAGRAPTIPPLDLSVSRFGVVQWAGDEALRTGGSDAPKVTLAGVLGELAPIGGVANGAGAPTLFVPTLGLRLTNNDAPEQYQSFVPQLAIYDNSTWRIVSGPNLPKVGGSNDYTSVTAFSRTEAYLTSPNGLLKFDGTTIAQVSTVSEPLFAVASAVVGTAKYVIAGGNNGAVWIGNTQSWQRYTVPVAAQINGVCITGPNEAFVSTTGGGGTVFRFDGTAWTAVPTQATGPKLDLQCPAPGQAFILSSGSAAYQWNGTSWNAISTTAIAGTAQMRWGVVSPTEIYAYRDSALVARLFYRYNGTAWSSIGRTRLTTFGGARPWALPTGGAAYVVGGNARIERMTPSGVSVVSYQPSLRDVYVNAANSAFVVGASSFLSRWTGAQWVVDAPPEGTPSTRMLHGVWSSGPSNAWAVGQLSTVYSWNGASWTMVSDSLRPAAVRDDYNAVWGSGSDVWAVGESSILHCTAPVACTNESSGGTGALLSVWGSAANNVFAVGDGGRILRYNGTAWSSMTSPTNRALARVSGSGPNDVWAVGDSVLLHYNGTAWANVPMVGFLSNMRSHVQSSLERAQFSGLGNFYHVALWARGPREVYLSNEFGTIARYDGSGWIDISEGRYRHRMMAIHGAAGPAGCTLGVTEVNYVLTGPTLWRGVGPSGCFSAPMQGPAAWR